MKKLMFMAAALLLGSVAWCQEFEVPENYSLKKASDYEEHKEDVIAAVHWLENTPAGEQESKRKEVNAFVITYVTGAPDVSVMISEKIVTFMDCPDCLVLFMGGWTVYALENGDDPVKGAMAGLDAVMNYYEANKAVLGKNKNIEKFIRLRDKGELESYVRENLK